jgi:hypothetical protein
MASKSAAPPPEFIDLSDYELHPGQQKALEAVRKFKLTLLAPGRRWGKSSLRLFVTLDQVKRREGWVECAWGAQSHAEATTMWENDLLALQGVGLVPKNGAKNEDQRRFIDIVPIREVGLPPGEGATPDDEITFDCNGGARIWYPSLGPDAHGLFQGKGLIFAGIDEFSWVPMLAWTSTLRPMLGDYAGHGILIGSPYPEGPNFDGFKRLWDEGDPSRHTAAECPDPTCTEIHRNPDYFSMSGASIENYYLPPEGREDLMKQEREMIAAGDHSRALCLYHGIFAKDLGAVFKNLVAVFCLKAEEEVPGLWVHRRPKPNEKCVMGLDLGKHDDSSVASVIAVESGEQLAVLRMRGDYIPQLSRIDRLYKDFNRPVIYADARGNETTLELLVQKYGDGAIPVKWTSGGRWDKESQVIRGQTMFQQTAWKLIALREQEEEFRVFSKTALPSGGWRYAAPNGSHDDFVTATLYALYGLPYIARVVTAKESEIAMWSTEMWDYLEDSQIKPSLENPYSLRRRA